VRTPPRCQHVGVGACEALTKGGCTKDHTSEEKEHGFGVWAKRVGRCECVKKKVCDDYRKVTYAQSCELAKLAGLPDLAKLAEAELFAELEQFGVRHEDRELRNITYRISDGRFCVIDFEFATLLDGSPNPVSLKPSG
jgi:hypothetical protein